MKILIYHPEGNVSGNPTLDALTTHFSQKNIKVIVYKRGRGIIRKKAVLEDGKMIISLPKIYWVVSALLNNYVCMPSLSAVFAWLSVNRKRIGTPSAIIGVDRQGGIEAYMASKILGAPLYILSFELQFLKETGAKYKALEIKSAKFAKKIIVPCSERATLYIRENNVDEKVVLKLPVAPDKRKRETGVVALRKQLGIPENMKVVIMMGSIAKWTMVNEVIDSVKDWPAENALILHHRFGDINQFRNKFAINNRERVYLSSHGEVPFDEMDWMFAGVSFGMAFYEPDMENKYLGENLKHIGLSSGKLSTYLKYGVPVITNVRGEFSQLIKKYDAGIIVDHPSGVAKVLESQDNIEDLKRGACKLFDEKLCFDVSAKNISASFGIQKIQE